MSGIFTPNKAPANAGANDAVVAQIRANVVFENMIVSVLIIAALSAAAHFAIGLAARALEGALSFGGAASAFFAAIGFASLFFLGGFASALAFGIPLFRALERAKIRKAWPFALAALAVGFVVLAAMDLAPTVEAPARALYLLPGLAAALLFARKMRAFWRADETQMQIIRRR